MSDTGTGAVKGNFLTTRAVKNDLHTAVEAMSVDLETETDDLRGHMYVVQVFKHFV